MLKRHSYLALCALIIVLTSCAYAWGTSPGLVPVTPTASVNAIQSMTDTPTATATPLPAVRIIQGDDALFAGDYDQAIVEYQSILNLVTTPDVQLAAQFGLAKTYYLKGDCNTAMPMLQNLYATTYAAPAYYFNARCLERSQNYAEAVTDYQNYLRLKPAVIDAYIDEQIGDDLSLNGDFSSAINAYFSALQADPPGDFDTLNLKICQQYLNLGDYTNAIRSCMDLYAVTQSTYTKSTANLLAGRAYLALAENDPTYLDQAYARFQDSVTNYRNSYDTYSQLLQLVNDGVPVNDLDRGIIDYYVGQYGLSIEALTRYLNATPEHDGSANFYLALSYTYNGQYDEALSQYDAIITGHVGDTFWTSAWDEKAYTLWFYKEQYADGAQVLLDFVALEPASEDAAQFLFDAGRIYERGGLLPEAASTWDRLINEYPSSELSLRALFLSGITYYRLADYDTAQTTFQRSFILSTTTGDQAAAQFWIGKSQAAKGDQTSATTSWQQAEVIDPTGYYGIRAGQLLNGKHAFSNSDSFDLAYDLQSERVAAGEWLLSAFSLPSDSNLDSLGDLAANFNLRRGDAFYEIGEYELADSEFDALRTSLALDPLNCFRFLPHLLDLHMYRQAILASRQILDNANLDDADTLLAPKYFNHIRFGTYYRSLVVSLAQAQEFDPLLLFSLIRQESMFEGHISSSAGAIGLMQIMPATGQEIADQLGWPSGYDTSDLYLPAINVPLGIQYLARQRAYFGGNVTAALASYNAGAGNVANWLSLANNDNDLFVELIRYDETRNYVMQITEFLNIYQMIYLRPQQ
jgi:soluble lytic murein transglycosylase